MRGLIEGRARGSTVRIAALGCSIGLEVYSILWILRRGRPDLKIVVELSTRQTR
jgi:chemotaxis methyl-accepting protein methylase